MKLARTLLIAAIMVSSSTVVAADKIDADDFVKKAGAAGAAEVAMGTLGADKATNAEVKAFAQRMVKDHTKANKELTAVAAAKGLKVPTEPGVMHKGMKEKFEHQSADADFNHDFMQQMVRDHEAAVELFTTAANDTTLDPELRALAKKTLPTLQEHFAEAKKLEAKLGK
jgi:putative membrane protein